MNIWIKCPLPGLSESQWRLAILRGVSIYFPGQDVEYPWQDFEKYSIMCVPEYDDFRRFLDTLEFYASHGNYHPNGSPGSAVEELGIEVWAADRGHRARGALDMFHRKKCRITSITHLSEALEVPPEELVQFIHKGTDHGVEFRYDELGVHCGAPEQHLEWGFTEDEFWSLIHRVDKGETDGNI